MDVRRKPVLQGALAALALSVPAPVAAYPITIDIEATVRYLDDPGGGLEGAIGAGSLITGSYTYESATPDGNDIPTVGDYWHDSAPYGISLNAGGFVFATDPADVQFLVEIVNDHYTHSDNYLLRSYRNSPLSNGALVEHISWQLDDWSLAALSSEALPLGAPVLADWPADQPFALSITGGIHDPNYPWPIFPGKGFFIRADVTSAKLRVPEPPIGAVPEPAGMSLMAIGLAGLAIGFGRRKRAGRGS